MSVCIKRNRNNLKITRLYKVDFYVTKLRRKGIMFANFHIGLRARIDPVFFWRNDYNHENWGSAKNTVMQNKI
jgi:hypothetical protein